MGRLFGNASQIPDSLHSKLDFIGFGPDRVGRSQGLDLGGLGEGRMGGGGGGIAFLTNTGSPYPIQYTQWVSADEGSSLYLEEPSQSRLCVLWTLVGSGKENQDNCFVTSLVVYFYFILGGGYKG